VSLYIPVLTVLYGDVWLDFGLLLIQLISIYRMFFIINISLYT